jgi:hypothetical protein
MKNHHLNINSAWRFCEVRAGSKQPWPAGWQNQFKTLNQITSTNLGLLLGEPSGGLVALDFDGTSAWSWFAKNIGCDLPDTVMWSSGKQDRCQMLFSVPADYWPLLRTLKLAHTRDADITPGEGFEFRWTGTQSVMPPSQLDDGRIYNWLRSPADTTVAELPEAILHWWVLAVNPEPQVTELVEYPPATEAEVLQLAAELRSLYSEFDYDTWTRVTWAFCNTIGYTDGIALMKYHYPEQVPGEYGKLGTKPPAGRRCGLGTIKRLITDRRGRMKKGEIKLMQLGMKLREKYNIQG